MVLLRHPNREWIRGWLLWPSLLASALFLSSCQLGYIAESAYYQADLLRKRVPLKYALDNYKLTTEEQKKIKLAIEVRKFMASTLKLNTQSNYSRYVHLDRPYVSYAVNAAAKDQLKAYTWKFPIIGSVPYKAYFKKQSAEEEQKELQEKGLDTYLRGVSAYSTLGWFEDPLLSSMLRMKDHDFVNTLIHETVHANLYIESQSKFNERVASFLGLLGMEAYYKKLNRQDELKTLIAQEAHDELLFSEFISQRIKSLRTWYQEHKDNNRLIELREVEFDNMKEDFKKNVQPKLKTNNYNWFVKKKLNNAFLLLLELYNSDYAELEVVADHYGRDFLKVFQVLKELESSQDPEAQLKELVEKLTSTN